MICHCLRGSIYPSPATARIPSCRPSWAPLPVTVIQPEACIKLQGAAPWIPYISDPRVKKLCSLRNSFYNLYRKQKCHEHKTLAISITLWSFKILMNLVYYSCITIFMVCAYYFILSLKIISIYWHNLLIFNSYGKLLYIDVLYFA